MSALALILQRSVDSGGSQDVKHPTNIGWPTFAIALSLCSVAFIAVTLRWWTRIALVKKVGVDDALITCSLVRNQLKLEQQQHLI